jgi:transcriptional regulator with XRE-family HTH domain
VIYTCLEVIYLNRLAELRKSNGLSQQQFAKIFDVAQNTVSNWENGNRLVDTENLQKIADYFGVTTDYILCRDSKHTSQPTSDRTVSEEDIMFALFDGDKEITPEMYDEVKQFARFVREKHKNK